MTPARVGDGNSSPDGATLIVHVVADRRPLADARLLLDGTLCARTDASGTAIVRGLTRGRHRVWLFADGRADERMDLTVHEDPEAVHERFVTLRPGSQIEGRTVDEHGAPVAGAWVRVIASDGQLCYEARSDLAGRWRVSAGAGTYRANASSGGPWSPLVGFACDGQSPCDVVVRLESSHGPAAQVDAASADAPGRIAGTVVDTTNEPVANATVSVLKHGADATNSFTFVQATATTDACGRFDIGGLAEGEHDVIASAPAPLGHRDSPAPARVRAGDLNVTLVVPTGGAIAGRALLDGTPLSYFGVAITPTNQYGGQPIGVRASDGRFELGQVPPGTWRISLLAPGTRLWFIDDVRVEPGQTASLGDIALPRGVRIAGVVRDSSGAAVAGARVFVGSWTRHAMNQGSRLEQAFSGELSTTSDEQGAYLFDGIEPRRMPQRPAHIWATHPSRGTSILRELPDSDAAIDLVVVETGHIDAVVDGLRGGRPGALAIRADEPPHARMAFLDREGRFRFEDVPAGEYVVRLALGEAEQVAPVTVTVRADETAIARLSMTGSSVRLTIRVPDRRGRDLVLEPTSEGARVGGRIRGIMRTGSEDRCSFELVQPGTYRASLDGTTWHSIEVAAEPAEQTIDLRSA